MPKRLWGRSNGQYDEVMHSWADDAAKNSCLIWQCRIFFGQVYEVFLSSTKTWERGCCRRLAGTPSGFGKLNWDCFCHWLINSQSFWTKAFGASLLQSYVSKYFALQPFPVLFSWFYEAGKKKHMCTLSIGTDLQEKKEGCWLLHDCYNQCLQKQTSRSLQIMNSTYQVYYFISIKAGKCCLCLCSGYLQLTI